MAAQKLTLKQDRFVTEYLKSGNATDAAAKAGYSETSRMSLGAQAYENLKKPQIQKAIENALIKAEITPEWLTLQYKNIATGKTDQQQYDWTVHEWVDEYIAPKDRLKALESLSKIVELTGFRQPESVKGTTINGDITISFGQPVNALPKPIDSTDYTIIDSQ